MSTNNYYQQQNSTTNSQGGSSSRSSKIYNDSVSFTYEITDDITGKCSVPIFSGENGQDFADWLLLFENTSRICGWTADIKRKVLPTVLRGPPEQLINSASPSPYTNWTQATVALKNLYYPVTSTAFFQQELMATKKKMTENIEEYATRMLKLVNRYNLSVASSHDKLTDSQTAIYFYNGLPAAYKEQIIMQGASELSTMKEISNRYYGLEKEKKSFVPKSNQKDLKKIQSNAKQQPKSFFSSANKSTGQKQTKYCYYHKTNGHSAAECHYLKNKQQKNHQQSNYIGSKNDAKQLMKFFCSHAFFASVGVTDSHIFGSK